MKGLVLVLLLGSICCSTRGATIPITIEKCVGIKYKLHDCAQGLYSQTPPSKLTYHSSHALTSAAASYSSSSSSFFPSSFSSSSSPSRRSVAGGSSRLSRRGVGNDGKNDKGLPSSQPRDLPPSLPSGLQRPTAAAAATAPGRGGGGNHDAFVERPPTGRSRQVISELSVSSLSGDSYGPDNFGRHAPPLSPSFDHHRPPAAVTGAWNRDTNYISGLPHTEQSRHVIRELSVSSLTGDTENEDVQRNRIQDSPPSSPSGGPQRPVASAVGGRAWNDDTDFISILRPSRRVRELSNITDMSSLTGDSKYDQPNDSPPSPPIGTQRPAVASGARESTDLRPPIVPLRRTSLHFSQHSNAALQYLRDAKQWNSGDDFQRGTGDLPSDNDSPSRVRNARTPSLGGWDLEFPQSDSPPSSSLSSDRDFNDFLSPPPSPPSRQGPMTTAAAAAFTERTHLELPSRRRRDPQRDHMPIPGKSQQKSPPSGHPPPGASENIIDDMPPLSQRRNPNNRFSRIHIGPQGGNNQDSIASRAGPAAAAAADRQRIMRTRDRLPSAQRQRDSIPRNPPRIPSQHGTDIDKDHDDDFKIAASSLSTSRSGIITTGVASREGQAARQGSMRMREFHHSAQLQKDDIPRTPPRFPSQHGTNLDGDDFNLAASSSSSSKSASIGGNSSGDDYCAEDSLQPNTDDDSPLTPDLPAARPSSGSCKRGDSGLKNAPPAS